MTSIYGVYHLAILSQYAEIAHGFSTKKLGNMSPKFGDDYIDNLERFWQSQVIDSDQTVKAELAHGDTIIDVEDLNKKVFEADALITATPGIALYFVIADCVPILFYAPDKKVIAIAHCGWKSTDLHLAQKTALRLRDYYGCDLNRLVIGFGPSINKTSYLFDQPIEQGPSWQSFIERLPSGQLSVDVVGYNLVQLQSLGIDRKQIEVSIHNTARSELFYSHYRAVRNGETEGRFVAAIVLK